jgi:tRNA threonylcarbamoyl adenosine modification protein (Sua5/YciO/YrdC/YwlC family)
VTQDSDSLAFERCVAVGGVALFPSDTVYGLACDVSERLPVERLYALKRRSLSKPSAVMFFDLSLALAALPDLGERTRNALTRLLPGPVTVLLPNPAGRFPLACGSDPSTLGLRVPQVERLAAVSWPVLQSSANLAGGPDPRRLSDVPEALRSGADLVLDGGELAGVASTVVDLRRFEDEGEWAVLRQGALSESALASALEWQFHFDPSTYDAMIRADIPAYDRFQEELVAASGAGARRILELGTGTGETAARLLEHHPGAVLVGLDLSEPMLAHARALLPADRADLRVGEIQRPLPEGPFDLVASALCVHHLDGPQKADLFARVARCLEPGGVFVLGDVVVPVAPAHARISLTPGFDKPSPVADQLRWLRDAGFDPSVTWERGDLAVIRAELPA